MILFARIQLFNTNGRGFQSGKCEEEQVEQHLGRQTDTGKQWVGRQADIHVLTYI